MRATFITTALENGAQLEDVQKARGHRGPCTTKLYYRRGYNPEKAASFLPRIERERGMHFPPDLVERCVKIVGVAAGLFVVVGVLLQLYEINQRERQKVLDDWASAAVYKIIQESSTPISIPELLPKYKGIIPLTTVEAPSRYGVRDRPTP
jgi:hypothetical protein